MLLKFWQKKSQVAAMIILKENLSKVHKKVLSVELFLKDILLYNGIKCIIVPEFVEYTTKKKVGRKDDFLQCSSE